jgi:hypothetical protein
MQKGRSAGTPKEIGDRKISKDVIMAPLWKMFLSNLLRAFLNKYVFPDSDPESLECNTFL